MSGLLTYAVAAAVAASASPCSVPDTLGLPAFAAGFEQDGGLSVTLNIPAYRLDVHRGAGLVHSYTVAVGSRRYRTPVGRYAISSVELNPWWHPPDSEWARRERVTPPGPENPMGPAKLNFHELYFLHGTPQEQSLGSAASHGCVRMARADALDLARLVLRTARPDVPAEEIDAVVADHRRTRRYTLRTPVPLAVEYRTAEVRGDTLELHPDVYRRERGTLRSRALAALRRAGVADDRIDTARLDSVVRIGRREHVKVAIEQLLHPAVPPTSAEPAVGPRPPDATASLLPREVNP